MKIKNSELVVKILNGRERVVEKEGARQDDARAIASGRKSPEQVRRENERFAFSPDRVQINLAKVKAFV